MLRRQVHYWIQKEVEIDLRELYLDRTDTHRDYIYPHQLAWLDRIHLFRSYFQCGHYIYRELPCESQVT